MHDNEKDWEWCKKIADSLVDELVTANVVAFGHTEFATSIILQQLYSHLVSGDRPGGYVRDAQVK